MKMLNVVSGALFATSLFGSVAACSGGEGTSVTVSESEDAASIGSIRIYTADDGKTISVKQGQNFFIYLKSKLGTDSAWSVTAADSALGEPEVAFLPWEWSGGVSGRTRFKWATNNLSGKYNIALAYKSPQAETPSSTFHITVDVKAPAAKLGERCSNGTLGTPLVTCAAGLECTYSGSTAPAGPTGGSSGKTGVCTQAPACPDAKDKSVNYSTHDPLECAVMTFACGPNATAFNNSCGCGCISNGGVQCGDKVCAVGEICDVRETSPITYHCVK